MRALLIGSAPCLLEQAPEIDLRGYDIVAVVNDWLRDSTQALFSTGLCPTHYFFSDWLYFSLGWRERVDALPQSLCKVICCPPPNRLNGRRLPEKPRSLSVVDYLQRSKGIEVVPRHWVKFLSEIGACRGELWPSTGMIALGYLFLELGVASVDLAGFSFFEGKTHHYDEVDFDRKHHSVFSEKRIYAYFAQRYSCRTLAAASSCPSNSASERREVRRVQLS